MARINTPNQKSIELVYKIRYESIKLGITQTGKRHNTYGPNHEASYPCLLFVVVAAAAATAAAFLCSFVVFFIHIFLAFDFFSCYCPRTLSASNLNKLPYNVHIHQYHTDANIEQMFQQTRQQSEWSVFFFFFSSSSCASLFFALPRCFVTRNWESMCEILIKCLAYQVFTIPNGRHWRA